MKSLFMATCGLLVCFPWTALGGEYTRAALDSVSIPDGGDNSRNFDIAGKDVDIQDNDGNSIVPSYGLAPFRFHPRDFSLSQVETINSAQLSLTNEQSILADNGSVEVFYIPDSRADLGVALEAETDACGWNAPQLCYDAFYDIDAPGGIDASSFSAAPVSLGMVEIDFAEDQRFTSTFDIDLPDAVAESMKDRINADQGFHLAFGAVEDEGFLTISSFDSDLPDVRPQLALDVSGVAGGITKDLARQGSIHTSGDTGPGEFYGSGNDDDAMFSEFGIAGFEFSKADFGVADNIEGIGSVQLTLHHNERSFSDGDMVEFFLASDTAEELGYDEFLGYLGKTEGGEVVQLVYDAALDNGINEDQFVNAPLSLGTYAYAPKFGGVSDTFDLELSDEAEAELVASLNAGEDFHILIGVPDPTFDVTYSGLDLGWDPGNPQLTINLSGGGDPMPTEFSLDINADGAVNADDAALLCSAIGEAGISLSDALATGGVLPGDVDFNGAVEFADFLVLSGSFGGPGHYGEGDFDCNGNVEFADFLVMSGNFGATAAAAVPEPNGMCLLLVGLSGVAILRRRS